MKFFILQTTQKRQNLLKFGDLKYAYPDPYVCYFCVAQNFLYLKLKFCTLMGQFISYTMIFFLIFFKHINMFFIFSKIAGALVPKSTKSLRHLRLIARAQLIFEEKKMSIVVFRTKIFMSATPPNNRPACIHHNTGS